MSSRVLNSPIPLRRGRTASSPSRSEKSASSTSRGEKSASSPNRSEKSASSSNCRERSASNASSSTWITQSSRETSYLQGEEFSEYSARVFELCRVLWPDACHDVTEVVRMKTRWLNRQIGLSIVHSQGAEKTQYVLRIRSYATERVESDVAHLKFVKENSEIPVAEIVKFDITEDNPLQEKYMILARLPGETLDKIYPSLDHEGKCNIARELGRIFRQMQQMRSAVPGTLAPRQDEHGSSSWSMVQAFNEEGESTKTPRRDALPDQSCSEALIGIYEHQLAEALNPTPAHRRPNYPMQQAMENAIEMTTDMNELGYLDDNYINFCHERLQPSKIVVDCTTRPTITGILDWDDAMFAPRFMSCDPPLWMWARRRNRRRAWPKGQYLTIEMPATAELREVKRIFDEAAGPEYVRLAYEPHYLVARYVFDLAIAQYVYQENYYALEEIVDEWAEHMAVSDSEASDSE